MFYSEFITHRLPDLARWFGRSLSAYEYLPFAAGPHRCHGAELVIQGMKAVLAMLVQRYRLSLAEDAVMGPDLGMLAANRARPEGGPRAAALIVFNVPSLAHSDES